MERLLPRLLLLPVLLVAGTLMLSACTEEEEQQVKERTDQVKQDAREAWAGLRTDGERLVDRAQTRNDAEAKTELLKQCRVALEQMRKNNASQTGRVENLCARIQDADVNTSAAWDDVRSRLRELNKELGGS